MLRLLARFVCFVVVCGSAGCLFAQGGDDSFISAWDIAATAPIRAHDVVTVAIPNTQPKDRDTHVLLAQGPKKERFAVRGFFGQPYRRAVDGKRTYPQPTGTPTLRFRLTPTTAGRWTLTLKENLAGGGSRVVGKAHTIIVQPGKAAGFVRRAPNNTRYFQYDNGASYFLIGENVCWAGDRGLAEYDEWFASLARAGGNFARLWMAWQQIETKETGLGKYDENNAAYFDEILKLAQKHGIVCMLAFGTYGELRDGGFFNEGRWAESPYNARNGGPVPADKPEEFFTNPQARAFYKQRLEYIVARYGAYTSLGFWEFWNEKGAPRAWFSEMAKHIRAVDPYRHLITNSDTANMQPGDWDIAEFDLTQSHKYGDEGSIRDFAPAIVDDTRAHDVHKKPHLMGEYGISWRNSDSKFDEAGTGTNFHNGLWASAMSGAAGGAALWWWDNYVHPKNLYGKLTGLANFAKTVAWNRRDFQPIAVPTPILPATATETFDDLVLIPSTGWGDKATSPLVLEPGSGKTSGGPLLSTHLGPDKADKRSVQTIQINLPKPSQLTMRILTVSDSAKLRVAVDGKTLQEFVLTTAPGSGDFESTKQFPEYNNIYQALYNRDRTVILPAGRHTLTIENAAGDWVQIGSYTFANARSSRFAPLRTVALADKVTGETLLWLQDEESHWYNDREGKTPRPFAGVRLALPVPRAGTYLVRWWDTRKGGVVQELKAVAAGGRLNLTAPAFTRDIALRAIRLR